MGQQDYRISFDQPQEPQKVYGRSKKLGSGCFGIIAIIILLIVLVLAGYFFAYPALTPNTLKGDFLDMTVVPWKDGKIKLWIHTDGSFKYTQQTQSPGRFSISSKCLFCKTWTYIYDPAEEKVLKKIKTEYDDIIPTPDMFYKDGEVWIVSGEFIETEPIVNVYDAETGDLILDTKAFSNKYPKLQSGIVSLRTEENPNRLIINTRDGQNGIVYTLDEGKLYDSEQEFRKAKQSDAKGDIAIFVLGAEDNGPRKKLYKVTGPKDKLTDRSISESYLHNSETLFYFMKSTAEKIIPDKVYIEGMIFHQDNECVIILHQDNAGKKADRMLTCIDYSGKVKWTIQQDELFEKLKLDEDEDSFSNIFFMKNKIGVIRAGNIIVLKLEREGMMGFDYNTGEKLWTIDI